jgi:hypothetical protein
MLRGNLKAATTVVADHEIVVSWREPFAREVDRRLDVPLVEQQHYIFLLQAALTEAKLTDSMAQAFLLVDRSPQVQAAMIIVRTQLGGWHWAGETVVSTGKTGTFEHFITLVTASGRQGIAIVMNPSIIICLGLIIGVMLIGLLVVRDGK